MAKRNRKKRNKYKGAPVVTPEVATAPVAAVKKPIPATTNLPTIPAFWVAITIPLVCVVGAWTYPPVATPMELKSYASQIYLSGLLLLWYWLQRKSTIATLTFSPGRITFGLLFLAGTLSLIWANNPDFWVYKWNKWFAGFVMFILGLHITQNEKNLDTVVNLAIVGGLITAFIGIGQYLFLLDVVPQTSFPSSTFGNGNMAGQVMVLTVVLPFYFLFKENLPVKKIWIYALSVCVLMTYTYYTRTRAVWIACILEAALVLVFVVFDKVRRKNWLYWSRTKTIAAILSLLMFLTLINFSSDGFRPFWNIAVFEIASIATSIGSSAAQGEPRYIIWGIAIEIIKANPWIGSGLGSFFDVYNNQGFNNYNVMGVQRVHNEVLELGVELGLLGWALLLGIIVTMCILLYKLIIKSEGRHRLLFALFTIAVTGSMLNAQLSFPFELPVPLVIMPFYMALVIRGSENIEHNTWTVSLKPWFNKAAVSVCGLIFAFMVVNDLVWMRDIHVLNKIVAGQITNTPWKPINPIFNQAYITGSRSVDQALNNVNRNQLAQNVIEPLLKYWPDVAANTLLAAENNLALGNLDETEYWARKTIASQPADTYIGEYFLMQVYMRQNDMGKLRELYESMKAQGDESLGRYRNTFNIMHSMSINVQDFDMTTHYYEKFTELYGEFAPVVANQAVYYINIGDIAGAVPYMKRALEMEPNLPLGDQFRSILAQIPESAQ